MTDRISDEWLDIMIEEAKREVNLDPHNRKRRDHLWVLYDLRDLRKATKCNPST